MMNEQMTRCLLPVYSFAAFGQVELHFLCVSVRRAELTANLVWQHRWAPWQHWRGSVVGSVCAAPYIWSEIASCPQIWGAGDTLALSTRRNPKEP